MADRLICRTKEGRLVDARIEAWISGIFNACDARTQAIILDNVERMEKASPIIVGVNHERGITAIKDGPNGELKIIKEQERRVPWPSIKR